jgi:hypothetical protein
MTYSLQFMLFPEAARAPTIRDVALCLTMPALRFCIAATSKRRPSMPTP